MIVGTIKKEEMETKSESGQVWDFLKEMAQKKGITELAINAENRVFIERNGQFFYLNNQIDQNELKRFCQDVVTFNRQSWSEEEPFF